ncbi:hypothetical protein MJ904_00125 [Massilia sp. MB5]|uniref:hypothetical protein n=1 Tax=Massilia sp. MB5 TaxID=2919578 RepID=UPI001F111E90|nr:hypothetical protein [Massilia sp. MB5]UMR30727.1 hypothetical protein MJ904_00125 [Massilia sp. MB5]
MGNLLIHFGPPRCSETIKPLLFGVTVAVREALGCFGEEIYASVSKEAGAVSALTTALEETLGGKNIFYLRKILLISVTPPSEIAE